MPGGVFISYRREDLRGFAGRIYDRLSDRLGSENIFFDVDNIAPGLDFVEVLTERVASCDALVAVIGKDWLASIDRTGRRRLDDAEDFVRVEIEAALKRGVRVIPVLVENAAMPKADELPESLRKLARRQGIAIDHGRFNSDVERLLRILSEIEEEAHRARPPDARPPHPEATRQPRNRLRRNPSTWRRLATPAPGAGRERWRAEGSRRSPPPPSPSWPFWRSESSCSCGGVRRSRQRRPPPPLRTQAISARSALRRLRRRTRRSMPRRCSWPIRRLCSARRQSFGMPRLPSTPPASHPSPYDAAGKEAAPDDLTPHQREVHSLQKQVEEQFDRLNSPAYDGVGKDAALKDLARQMEKLNALQRHLAEEDDRQNNNVAMDTIRKINSRSDAEARAEQWLSLGDLTRMPRSSSLLGITRTRLGADARTAFRKLAHTGRPALRPANSLTSAARARGHSNLTRRP